MGLVELLTLNSIPNIDEGKNKFYVGEEVITIFTGSYEIEDIENYLQKVLSIHDISISLQPNKPAVPLGYKIVKEPSHAIYPPIAVQAIDHLQLKIIDQDGQFVNLRGEIVTIRLHIKS